MTKYLPEDAIVESVWREHDESPPDVPWLMVVLGDGTVLGTCVIGPVFCHDFRGRVTDQRWSSYSPTSNHNRMRISTECGYLEFGTNDVWPFRELAEMTLKRTDWRQL